MGEKNMSTSSRDKMDSFEFIGDSDMKIAKKVITGLTTDIVSIIQHEISSILDSARSKGLIGEGMYSKYRREKHDPRDVAREFLEAVEGQFMMDSSKFDALLEIFESTPPSEIISKRIREELASEMLASKESDSDVFGPPSLPSLTKPGFEPPVGAAMSSQQMQSKEKEEIVTGNLMAGQGNVQIMELDHSKLKKFTTQAGYDEENEPVRDAGGTNDEKVTYTTTPARSPLPNLFYQAESMIQKEKTKAKTLVQKSADALRQVNEDLQFTDFTPAFNTEVQVASNNYQKYMVGVEKKESEMEELKEAYEKKLEKVKAKYKEKIRGKEEQAEVMAREMEELRTEYDERMENLMEEVQQLKSQANVRDSNFKIQTMSMTIEYSKEVAKLKDEIAKLQDVIIKLREELTQSKLNEKDRIIEKLEERLKVAGQHHQLEARSGKSTGKTLMEATGEHS